MLKKLAEKKLFFFCFFLALLGIDAILKYYVFFHLPVMGLLHPLYPYGGIGIFTNVMQTSFAIVHVSNQGAAWGFLSAHPDLLWWMRLLIILFLASYVFFKHIALEKKIALGLILTGAISNLLDRIFYGAVIDMFYFQIGSYSHPVFNLADSYITVGIIWFLLTSLKEERPHAN